MIKLTVDETYSEIRIDKHLSHGFPIQNSLKQGDVLPPVLFNFALNYVIWKVQEHQEGLEFMERISSRFVLTMLIYWVKTQITIITNKEALLQANMEVGLEVNTKKTKHIFMSCHQNAGKIHSPLTVNKSTESMAMMKYLGTTVRNQNFIR
jgi:hypothetical protein